MQISELAKGIAAKFEHSRLVFWYDTEQRFTEEFARLASEGLPGLDVCLLNNEGTLSRMRISLGLDDGVKINYGKFGDLLANVKYIAKNQISPGVHGVLFFILGCKLSRSMLKNKVVLL